MKLPASKNGHWHVGNKLFADIIRTKNLNFDSDGYIRIAKKPISIYNANDNGGLGSLVAIVPDDTNSVYYAVTSGNSPAPGVFTVAFNPLTVTAAATGGSPPTKSAGSDAVFFNGTLHVSGTTTVHDYSASTWTSRITGLSSSYPHPMCVAENLGTTTELIIGDGFNVKAYNTSYTNNGTSDPWTVQLPKDYIVTGLRWVAGNIYIGTRSLSGGSARLFVWDGVANTLPRNGYAVNAKAIYSMCEYDGSIALTTSAGQLLYFTGAGFKELAHLPCYTQRKPWQPAASIATASYDRVPNRGMTAIGTRIFINLKGEIGEAGAPTYLIDQPSGVWVYDPNIGLYHRTGHQHNKCTTLTVTALSSNVLTVGTHGLSTGDPVTANSVSNITGLTSQYTYYAIVTHTDRFKLAKSRVDAINNLPLTLSGTPSGDTLVVDDTTSFGAIMDTTAGAISAIEQSFTSLAGSVLFGAEPINDTNTQVRSLNSFGAQANRGYLVTSPIPASGVQDFFQKLVAFCESFVSDSIVVKYRLYERNGVPTASRTSDTALAIWTSTTTFTIATGGKDVKSAAVGDEMEIISGSASGYSSKITAIDTSSATYTYTIADILPVDVNDKSEIIIDNWTLLNSFDQSTFDTAKGYIEIPIDRATYPLIQFKVELRGYDVKLRALNVVSKNDKPPV